ncbi:MAG: FG-GAP repeat protein [Ekhidna sp.]|nr:FG-GAP repeat protein [Ekhidna sp.]
MLNKFTITKQNIHSMRLCLILAGLVLCLVCSTASAQFTFTEKTMGVNFSGVRGSSIAFADVNGDMYQDVLITGFAGD